MYDFLLFVHVLSAFVLVAAVVVYTGFLVGVPASPGTLRVGEILWGIGGLGTLVFGVWLAFNVEAYDLLDGWILAALVLWVAANAVGQRAYQATKAGTLQAATPFQIARIVIVVAMLVDMIFKPGA